MFFKPMMKIGLCGAVSIGDEFLSRTIGQQSLYFWAVFIQLALPRAFGSTERFSSRLSGSEGLKNPKLAHTMGKAARVFVEQRSFENAFLDTWEMFDHEQKDLMAKVG